MQTEMEGACLLNCSLAVGEVCYDQRLVVDSFLTFSHDNTDSIRCTGWYHDSADEYERISTKLIGRICTKNR